MELVFSFSAFDGWPCLFAFWIFPPKTHLDGHGPHDGPLVPLERLERHLRDLLVRLAQELLARRQQHLLVLTLDLDLGRQIQI